MTGIGIGDQGKWWEGVIPNGSGDEGNGEKRAGDDG